MKFGRWVMHDGMPYGRNQGQGHSREVDLANLSVLRQKLVQSRKPHKKPYSGY